MILKDLREEIEVITEKPAIENVLGFVNGVGQDSMIKQMKLNKAMYKAKI